MVTRSNPLPLRDDSAPTRTGGFTLVELLVVIGIIAVLISILLPTLGRAREQATMIKCKANLHNFGIALQNYAAQNKGWLPVVYTHRTGQTHAPFVNKVPVRYYSDGGNWMWDISADAAALIVKAGANQRNFYCPTTADLMEKDNFYNFGNPDMPQDTGERFFRVGTYIWLFDMPNTPERQVFEEYPLDVAIPTTDRGAVRATHLAKTVKKKINYKGSPINSEVAADTVLYRVGIRPNDKGFAIDQPNGPHETNHMRRRKPIGGNVLFLDGSVKFRDIKLKGNGNPTASNPYPKERANPSDHSGDTMAPRAGTRRQGGTEPGLPTFWF